jgi:hypothetical protein
MPRIRPRVIEDVFAARVTLHVHRHYADHVVAVALQHDVERLPARARGGAAALFEREQKTVLEKRIVGNRAARVRACIPRLRGDLIDGMHDSRRTGRV